MLRCYARLQNEVSTQVLYRYAVKKPPRKQRYKPENNSSLGLRFLVECPPCEHVLLRDMEAVCSRFMARYPGRKLYSYAGLTYQVILPHGFLASFFQLLHGNAHYYGKNLTCDRVQKPRSQTNGSWRLNLTSQSTCKPQGYKQRGRCRLQSAIPSHYVGRGVFEHASPLRPP